MKLSHLCFAVSLVLYGLLQLNPTWTVLHHWVVTLTWMLVVAGGVLWILEGLYFHTAPAIKNRRNKTAPVA